MDFLFNAAKGVAQTFSGQKIPAHMKNGKIVLDKKALAQSGRGQKGKGLFTDLLKTGAKQALRAAAQTGLDVLDNKRSLKDAIKTHGIRAIKNTAQPLLARGGPKQNKRPPPIKKPPIKRPVKKAPIKRPPIKRAVKKPPINRPATRSNKRSRPKRVLDIFD
jgi:hypothetical protein